MSQLENLIELIRTVNEVYFITAPERVRAAYILVDDIVELSLKTFLYEYTIKQRDECQVALEGADILTSNRHRNRLESYYRDEITIDDLATGLGQASAALRPAFDALMTPFDHVQHWSAQQNSPHVGFHKAVQDVKVLHPANIRLQALLDDIFNRHERRNQLYHDHQHMAWSIGDRRCLQAMCDLFELLEILFPDFLATIQNHSTVRCQIGVLRLKLAAEGNEELKEPFKEALEQVQRNHRYDLDPRSVEHSLIHTVSNRFFIALKDEFETKISSLKVEVAKVDGLRRPSAKRLADKRTCESHIQILEPQYQNIVELLGDLAR